MNKHFKYFLSIMFLFLLSSTFAQKYTISGYVREKASGEELIGANIFIKELSKGTISNTYGFYSLTFEKGTYNISVSYLGYENYTQMVNLDKNIKLNINLVQASYVTEEVVVTGERSDKNVKSTEMSTIKMSVAKIKALPAFMGEVDILKTIQLLPGVQSSGEGNAGFYVRGGGPDQNLILLDGATVYNSSHLFGFFSVFNADAIKDINLIKGGMPAQYGGRLSSVLDISMKEGNMKKLEVDGGIGLISSRLTVQGPIKKDKCSFIVSARRTYIDILAQPFIKDDASAKGSGYFFYDLNTKVNYRFSDKDRIFLSGYFGRDVFTFNSQEDGFTLSAPWGNATTSLRWNHLFGDKLFVNTTAIFSDYQFEFGAEQSEFEFKLFSGITDYTGKVDFTYIPSILHNIKFGVNYINHTFVPSTASARIGDTEFDTGKIIKQYANDIAIYINDDFDITEKLKISAGLRGSLYQHIGPFRRYILNSFDVKTDTVEYGRGEVVAEYFHVEPRLSLRYALNSSTSLKASYTRNYQPIHLATISSLSLPTDVWVSSSDIVKPQIGIQYAAGYFKNFKDNLFETSVEVYYKKLENQVAYKEGATPGDDAGNNSDSNFTFGDGESYGLELFLKKRFGKTTGWIGYTLSKTTRFFEEINNGIEYSAKYDRRHDLSFTATHELNDKWTFSTVFVYATGDAYTPTLGRYLIDYRIVNEYGAKNSARMKSYHRMDISATYTPKKKRRFQSSWNFAIYNLYNRKNPYFIYFDTEGSIHEGSLQTKAYQVSLFPILPSVTWNFKF